MISQVAGAGGNLLWKHWVEDCWPLITAISQCCSAASKEDVVLQEASKAMDLWAQETGRP